MNAQPESILKKLPFPVGFEKLPKNLQERAKSIYKSKNFSWDQRYEVIKQIINSFTKG